jgi:hypothetical protein
MKKKIKLEDLKVQSFSTSNSLSKDETKQIVGGIESDAQQCPTLNIPSTQCCTPYDTEYDEGDCGYPGGGGVSAYCSNQCNTYQCTVNNCGGTAECSYWGGCESDAEYC